VEKEKQNELEGCLKTLLFLEHSKFPDEVVEFVSI